MTKEHINLENSVLDTNKSNIELSLSDAVYEFRKEYIVAVAQQTAKFDIYAMSRTLNYDRSELSKFVNETAVKPQLTQIRETYNPSEWYTKSPTVEITDPIIREVIVESISENDYDIKKATSRFKRKYVNKTASQHGIKKAAEILEVNERTIRNYLNPIIADIDLTSRLN
jgi:hypothetical protein